MHNCIPEPEKNSMRPRFIPVFLLTTLLLSAFLLAQNTPSQPRPRDLGIPFDGTPGPFNALTDVPGVEVGYTTLVRGDGPLRVGEGPVRTGVTAVLPRGREGAGRACA